MNDSHFWFTLKWHHYKASVLRSCGSWEALWLILRSKIFIPLLHLVLHNTWDYEDNGFFSCDLVVMKQLTLRWGGNAGDLTELHKPFKSRLFSAGNKRQSHLFEAREGCSVPLLSWRRRGACGRRCRQLLGMQNIPHLTGIEEEVISIL